MLEPPKTEPEQIDSFPVSSKFRDGGWALALIGIPTLIGALAGKEAGEIVTGNRETAVLERVASSRVNANLAFAELSGLVRKYLPKASSELVEQIYSVCTFDSNPESETRIPLSNSDAPLFLSESPPKTPDSTFNERYRHIRGARIANAINSMLGDGGPPLGDETIQVIYLKCQEVREAFGARNAAEDAQKAMAAGSQQFGGTVLGTSAGALFMFCLGYLCWSSRNQKNGA